MNKSGSVHSITYAAIKNGELKKEPCSVCGCEKSVAHHPDYNKPLKIIWLCRKCHRAEHKKKVRISNRLNKGLARYLKKYRLSQSDFATLIVNAGAKCIQSHVFTWLSGGIPHKKTMHIIKQVTNNEVTEKDFY